MRDGAKPAFMQELDRRYGPLRKIEGSQSLFSLPDDSARIYVRYSKVHGGDRTFYGLRHEDLLQLEGHPSVICFLWDGQSEPLIIPYAEYEDVFRTTETARDGQYKVQVFLDGNETELYIAQAGRFNVEGNLGWDKLQALIGDARGRSVPDLSHSQVQTLLGAIGVAKGHDVWIPLPDRSRLDWSLSEPFGFREEFPCGFGAIEGIVQGVDVIWVRRGSSRPHAFFEVEHSTPIYSGLLRFNDIHLVSRQTSVRYTIVANEVRRDVFAKQLNRPTFRQSGLAETCSFLDYSNVYQWYARTKE